MKRLILLALISVLTFASSLYAETKVGVIAPLSGDVALWGVDTRRAVTLANEMLPGEKLEFIFEDDRCLGPDAARAAQKLLSIDKVQFGMPVCTESTLSVAPIFEQRRELLITPGGTAASVTDAGDYIFRTWPSDAKIAEVLLEYVKPRFKKVAALTENRGYSEELTKSFLAGAKEQGIATVSEYFMTEDKDLRSMILKLRKKEPDVLLISTNSERTLLLALRQMKDLHWDIPILSGYIAGVPAFLEDAGELSEGIVFGDSPVVNCETDQPGCSVYREFMKRYSKAEASEYMVASSIAVVQIIKEIAKLENPKQALYQRTFSTAVGDISFDSNGDVVGPKHSLRVIKNGRPVSFE